MKKTAAILVLIFLQTFALQLVAQDIESVDAILSSATAQLLNIEFERCIESTVNALTLMPNDLYDYQRTPEVRARVVKALELQAIARFNLGLSEESDQNFKQLLELAPGHKLNEELAAAKIIKRFESLRKSLVGYLNLTTIPAGAVVFYGERILGQSNIAHLPMLAGDYQLRLQLPGYREVQMDLKIVANAFTSKTATLERTDASLALRTSPADVEVYLDDRLIGSTSGVATDEYREKAAEMGLTLDQVSADFVINRVPLGHHKLEFKKPCYKDRVVRLPEITSPIDYNLPQIFDLEKEVGVLVLSSLPSDAEVYLNGTLQEKGKQQFNDLCAGNYHLDVVSRAGRFTKDINIKSDETARISVEAKPAMLLVSSLLNTQINNPRFDRVKQTLRNFSKQIKSFSVTIAGENGFGTDRSFRVLSRQLRNISLAGRERQVSADVYQIIRRTLTQQKARLMVVMVPELNNGQPMLRAYIFNDLVPNFEVVAVSGNGVNSIRKLEEKLNYSPVIEKGWLGVTVVDTRLFDNPVIIDIQPDSPAERAGLEIKSRIKAVNNSPVTSAAQFKDLTSNWHSGDSIRLTLNLGEDIEKTILLEYSPALIAENDSEILYNVVLARMGAEMDGANRNSAIFNSSIALMKLGAYNDAVRLLTALRLGSGSGINQGTVFFYLGKCYEAMGQESLALENYLKAARFKTATRESHNGPLLKYEVISKIKKVGAN